MDHFSAIQRAVDLVETRLREPIPIERLAREVGLSYWHFQRIFAAYVGEPVGFYIRRRRLTVAAEELRQSPRRILDVALDYQFESHEAFTRAFQALFGISPSELRRRRHYLLGRSRPPLTPAKLKRLSLRAAMNVEIVTLPTLTLVGPHAHFISAMSPDANNLKVIPPLFRQLFSRKGEMPAALDAYSYGACRCLPASQRTREDELEYMAGLSVDAKAVAPAGMGKWSLPGGTYAHFVHRGPITKLSETINYAHGAWLPRSEYDYDGGVELERYGERFGDGSGASSEMDYLVKVRRK